MIILVLDNNPCFKGVVSSIKDIVSCFERILELFCSLFKMSCEGVSQFFNFAKMDLPIINIKNEICEKRPLNPIYNRHEDRMLTLSCKQASKRKSKIEK